ncbi:MAG TPA: hypothetical protein VIF13_08785 [Hyphomicrobium sp.]|jgi:hypothetical protein
MADFAEQAPRNISPYYSLFQVLFDTVDTTSFFWQPMLKAIGGSQLEMAGLQARQAQAVIHWTHQVLRPASPMDLADANAQLWQTMIENCMDVAPRVAAAASSATQSVAPIVLPLPVRRSRDTLVLLDRGDHAGDASERRVA